MLLAFESHTRDAMPDATGNANRIKAAQAIVAKLSARVNEKKSLSPRAQSKKRVLKLKPLPLLDREEPERTPHPSPRFSSPPSSFFSHHSPKLDILPLQDAVVGNNCDVSGVCSARKVSHTGLARRGSAVYYSARCASDPNPMPPQSPRCLQPRGKAVCGVQQWFDARLRGLTAGLFHGRGVAIYTIKELECPGRFDGPFYNYGLRHFCSEMPEEEKAKIISVAAILIFSDVDKEDLQEATSLCQCIRQIETAPPVVLVPHSAQANNARGANPLFYSDLDVRHSLLSDARDAGFDSVIPGEPQCFSLVLAVSNEIRQHSMLRKLRERRKKERSAQIDRARVVRTANDFIVWDFLRSKIAEDTIPPVDLDILPCETGVILDGFTVGQVLGEGAFGKVFALTDARNSTSTGRVLKVLAKAEMATYSSLVRLNRQLEIMGFLTDIWKHPNVGQLHSVFHSSTQVLLQMRDAGPLNLRSRLKQRTTKNEDGQRPLSAKKAASALSQCLKAVCHLHMGPQVVHRDIKPGNYVVSETKGDIQLSLVDFDCASFASADAVCRGTVGTFSYMAPEMILRRRYSPRAADIWSVGVVCLEVLCGLNVLKTALDLPVPSDTKDRPQVSQMIVSHFEQPESVSELVTKFMMPELKTQFESSHALLDGMLKVHAPPRVRLLMGQPEVSHKAGRWKAEQVIQELSQRRDFGQLRSQNLRTRD